MNCVEACRAPRTLVEPHSVAAVQPARFNNNDSAAQALIDRKGPREVGRDCVEACRILSTSGARRRGLRANSNAITPLTCAVARDEPEAKS